MRPGSASRARAAPLGSESAQALALSIEARYTGFACGALSASAYSKDGHVVYLYFAKLYLTASGLKSQQDIVDQLTRAFEKK